MNPTNPHQPQKPLCQKINCEAEAKLFGHLQQFHECPPTHFNLKAIRKRIQDRLAELEIESQPVATLKRKGHIVAYVQVPLCPGHHEEMVARTSGKHGRFSGKQVTVRDWAGAKQDPPVTH